ncbi:DUF2306 domain-containing protein [Pandoraea apista]|uniref:DUF2306 domain-containing protein n=1 Tax=Pandoraea apista TaxID=93218 RepID=A0ABX9ZRC6_9BURK|nr:DUF2306 domain-containing protein [Pandoraea apista]PTE01669.1 hypothetical protein C7830_07235 [Pandoraea apista]RRJ27837.1 DUF2306 domain-containing protein [Pandoraea apista]RRJ79474.1 DUF2306 domain-containing protein [Pandoraea apista]RSD15209.1 DUF2306 domain-containing protein [Pandoraea apista]RSD22460.1 DUF2306 domain-containing protein [Pandoraea apista]
MATIVEMHLAAAVAAVLLGAAILFMRRGTLRHRWTGRLWVAAMAVAAATSFGIRELGAGRLSWLHALSAYVLVGLVLAVVAIRRGDVSTHRRQMLGLYAGLVIAGVAAILVPGRALNGVLARLWHHGATVVSDTQAAPVGMIAMTGAKGDDLPGAQNGRSDRSGVSGSDRSHRDKQAGALKQTQRAPTAEPGSLAVTGRAGA